MNAQRKAADEPEAPQLADSAPASSAVSTPQPLGVRAQQGEDTRNKILHLAMNLASERGLDTLTIGDLAKELGMSKSGLFAHFGSKEELQVATIGAAVKVFMDNIVTPAFANPTGVSRLLALLEGHVRHMEHSVFTGGCFFSAATAEFDDKPGRVRDRIVDMMARWADVLVEEVKAGQAAGEIDPAMDPVQLVFELKAMTSHANSMARLMSDPKVYEYARVAIRSRVAPLFNFSEGQVPS